MSTASRNLLILDGDIKKAENLLSSDGNKICFDPDSSNILECMETCFIKACPGSGKTTTLVGKLAILADKLPQNYEGICVLSHTNVAKDEIRKRLGNKAERLLKYPNFIGTIQSFVDTYLARQAMIDKFNVKPKGIDDDIFTIETYKKYNLLNEGKGFFYSYENGERVKKKVEFNQIRYKFSSIDEIYFKDYTGRQLKDTTKKQYIDLKRVKDLITSEGIIAYDDAFALANWYVNKYPSICKQLSIRFPYVFIDEVQDTSENQLAIINNVFKNSIIQYFGDLNQNLYDHKFDILAEIKKSIPDIAEKSIKTTYRLSPSICMLSQHVCKDKGEGLKASIYLCGENRCNKCGKCKNEIILYDDNTVQEVLPLYAQLISDQKKNKPDMGDCYKAVGQVAKKPEKERDETTKRLNIVIPTYYPNFNSIKKDSSINYSQLTNFYTIVMFIKNDLETQPITKSLNTSRIILLKTLIKILELQNGEKQSNKYVLDWFKERNELCTLNNYLFNCLNYILVNEKKDDIDYLREITITLLTPLFNDQTLLQDTKNFLEENELKLNDKTLSPKIENKFNCPETNISIQISTIAGIKGETHDATLLLETYEQSQDLKKYLKLIANCSFTDKQWAEIIDNKKLNLIYVAMTRPKHLLCLAMHKDSFKKNLKQNLESLGWEINDLTEKQNSSNHSSNGQLKLFN